MRKWKFIRRVAVSGAFVCLGVLELSGCQTDTVDAQDEGNVDTTKQALSAGWEWRNVTGMACGSGAQTGIGYSAGSGSDVLVYFMGGGACWGDQPGQQSCAQGNYDATAFDKDQFSQGNQQYGIFNRNDANNPFRTATYVFIPYCTGDLHGGNSTEWWNGAVGPDGGSGPGPDGGTGAYWQYRGAQNVSAAISYMQNTLGLTSPSKISVAGSSAGGYGAVINFWRFRNAYPNKPTYLIDDAAFHFTRAESLGINDGWAKWNTQYPPDCTDCATEYRNIIPYYSSHYTTNYRFGMIGHAVDTTILSYYYGGLSDTNKARFLTNETAMEDWLHAQPNTKFFIQPTYPSANFFGQDVVFGVPIGLLPLPWTHTSLGSYYDLNSDGDPNFSWLTPWRGYKVTMGADTKVLGTWLTEMVTDSPAWTSWSATHAPNGCGGCGTGMTCDTKSGQCHYVDGCTIGGANYAAGAHNPALSCQVCDPANPVAWSVDSGSCLIDGVCKSAGAQDDWTCKTCTPQVSQTTWTNKAEGCSKIVVAGLNFAQYRGDLGLANANALCAQQGATKNLPGTWKAMVSTSTQNLRDLVPTAHASKPVVNLQNQTMFPSWSSIFTTNQVYPAGYAFYKFDGGSIENRVWTGSQADGTWSGSSCVDWSKIGDYGWNGWFWWWFYYSANGADWRSGTRKFVDNGGVSCEQWSDWACVLVPPDSLPSVSITPYGEYGNVIEPYWGTYKLTRTGPTTAPLTVNLAAMTGTATKGTDYVLRDTTYAEMSTMSVTIPAGSPGTIFIVGTIDDTIQEAPETAIATIAPNAAYTINPAFSSATVTIIDND